MTKYLLNVIEIVQILHNEIVVRTVLDLEQIILKMEKSKGAQLKIVP